MKKLIQFMFIAVVLWSCSPGLSPKNTAKVEAAFSKYDDSEGKTLFKEKCARCHGYRLPETRTADKWPGIIDKMAPKAKLTSEQKEAVLAFVTKYAKAS
ncbi:c-type cytochrome [Chitinophaga lutea]